MCVYFNSEYIMYGQNIIDLGDLGFCIILYFELYYYLNIR